ncbi:MAG: hypothetical protein V4586_14760 [Pseudomonadota bacterium]
MRDALSALLWGGLRPAAGGGGVVADMATSLQTAQAIGMATVNSNVPITVGAWNAKHMFVVMDRVATVTSVAPNSAQVATVAAFTDGVTGTVFPIGTPYWANGAMIDPYIADGGTQGFDGLLAVSNGTSQVAAVSGYAHGSNADPSLAPISFNPSTPPFTLVKSVRKAGMTDPGAWRHFDDLVAIHFVSAIPKVGSVPPGVSDLNKSSFLDCNANTRIKAVLGPGFAYSAGMPTLATCLASNYFRALQPYWTRSGEVRRRMMIVDTDLSGTGYSGGTGGYGVTWSDFFAAMLAEGENAANQTNLNTAFEMALAFGAQLVGLYNRGDDRQGGAGQNDGHKQFAMLFGMAYSGVAGLLTKALAIQGNVTNQQYWMTAGQEGVATKWPGNHFVLDTAVMAEHIGRPAWAHSVAAFVPNRINTTHNADYEYTAGAGSFPEMLNIMLLKAGPGGQDGSQVITRNLGMIAANNDAAPVAYNDLYRTLNTNALTVSSIDPTLARHVAYHDDRRAGCAVAKWTGAPESFTPDANQGSYLAAISQGFSWNLTNAGGVTETVLQWAIEYSEDQKFWKSVASPAISGTQTGLPQRLLYVRWRRRSASGWGPWSVNHPRQTNTGTTRLTVTPTGTTVSVPQAITGQDLYVQKYPNWLGNFFVVAPAILSADNPYLYVSRGDVGNETGLTWTYDLVVNGVTVLAGVSDFNAGIVRKAAWAGLPCYAVVKKFDGVTNTSANTSTVTMPSVGGTKGLYRPIGAVGALPVNLTQLWGSGSELTYQASSVSDIRPVARMATNATAAARLWTLDELLPIGYLNNVAEGEIQAEVQYGISSGASNQFNDFVIRATGANAAAANGYVLKFGGSGTNRQIQLWRYVAGVGTQQTMAYTGGPGTSLVLPKPIGNVSAAGPSRIRFDWRMSGGSLIIRAKFWWESDDPETYPSTEPAAWQITYTDAAPLASGALGLGLRNSANDRDLFWMGIGVGATETAPTL